MKTAERARILMKKIEPDEPWLGPVLRLGELTVEERARLGLPPVERRRSEIIPWRCRNPACGHWTPEGSRAAGMCLICYTPKPADV